MATKYMHILDDRPAYFADIQIVFANRHRNSKAVQLERSLETIRFQQLLTKQYREKNGLDYTASRYGYVRVKFEPEES
jgi:hypothetical protein